MAREAERDGVSGIWDDLVWPHEITRSEEAVHVESHHQATTDIEKASLRKGVGDYANSDLQVLTGGTFRTTQAYAVEACVIGFAESALVSPLKWNKQICPASAESYSGWVFCGEA